MIENLIANNRAWSAAKTRADPGFFKRLVGQQNPRYLWIGCSDSRVPANEIVGLMPGELFVHRNVANVVVHSDLNCLSVMQFAVEVLKVKHIIVCGHYGCGGVKAAFDDARYGLIDNWLRHIQDIMHKYRADLDSISDYDARLDKLCEISVIEQVVSVGETTIVQGAWQRGQELVVHGWIYGLEDGLLRDLGVSMDSAEGMSAAYKRATESSGQNRER